MGVVRVEGDLLVPVTPGWPQGHEEGEQLGTGGACLPLRQVEYPQSVQRTHQLLPLCRYRVG